MGSEVCIRDRPYGMLNPGGFDYQAWLLQQGVGAVGYVREHGDNQLLHDSHWTIDRLRWRIGESMDHHLAGLTYLPLYKALIIGDKRGISRAQWDLFAATGTTHLMVISGLHVGLVAGLFYLMGKWLGLLCWPNSRAERWGALAAISAALLYALASGFSLPTQRAVIMVTVAMLCIASRRNISVASGLTLALLLCLIYDPMAVIGGTFWLSFTAVAVLLYCGVGRHSSGAHRHQAVYPQLWIFVGLLPVLAIVLGQVSLVSPLANVVLVPMFSFIVVPLNLLLGFIALVSTELALYLWSLLDLSLIHI